MNSSIINPVKKCGEPMADIQPTKFAYSNFHPWQGDVAVMQVLIFRNETDREVFNKRFGELVKKEGIENASDSGLGALLKLRAVRDSKGMYIPIIRCGVTGVLLAEYEPVMKPSKAIRVCEKYVHDFIKTV